MIYKKDKNPLNIIKNILFAHVCEADDSWRFKFETKK